MFTSSFQNAGVPLIALAGAVALCGCKTTVDVKPIKVEPIYMTIDVNIKVDHELDRFFDFEDQAAASAPASSQPATMPATQAKSDSPAPPPASVEGGAS